jgi:hypothetical protein
MSLEKLAGLQTGRARRRPTRKYEIDQIDGVCNVTLPVAINIPIQAVNRSRTTCEYVVDDVDGISNVCLI